MSISVHRRIFVIGKINPGLINSLTTRWIASLAHHYETVDSLQDFGELTLRRADFNTLIVGDGVTPEDRRRVLNIIEERPNDVVVGVFTTEPSYESWLPIPPNPTAVDIAEVLQFAPRVDPAQIVIISSTKGGVGKSTIATNLAIAMANMDKPDGTKYRVALIDDDRTTRSVRSLMGIEESAKTTADLVAEVNAARGVVTRPLVEKYLIESYGVKSLIGPHTIITDFPIEIDTAKDVLAIMSMELGFDFIVIDSPPDFINSSSFTYGILRNTRNEAHNVPLVLLPVIPEKALMRSVDDTLTALTHFQHPISHIFPIINCMRPTHDPESIRGDSSLWHEPAGIVPYVSQNQYVGDSGKPLTAEASESAFGRLTRNFILGQSTISETKKAYVNVGNFLIDFQEKQYGNRIDS